jgi:hypothetical protein
MVGKEALRNAERLSGQGESPATDGPGQERGHSHEGSSCESGIGARTLKGLIDVLAR